MNFNFNYLAECFIEIVSNGIADSQLKILDIVVYSTQINDLVPPTSLSDAVETGSFILDSLLYFSLPVSERPLVHSKNRNISLDHDFASDQYFRLSALFIHLLFRGSIPQGEQQLPVIVKNIFGDEISSSMLLSNLSTFKLSKMNFNWFSKINLTLLPDIIRNRLLLGVPGHRYINVIRNVRITTDDQRLIDIINEFKDYIGRDYYWDIFPLTRSQEFSTYFVSFNKVMQSLVASVYNESILNMLVRTKMIPTLPEIDERFCLFMSWDKRNFPKLERKMVIF